MLVVNTVKSFIVFLVLKNSCFSVDWGVLPQSSLSLESELTSAIRNVLPVNLT